MNARIIRIQMSVRYLKDINDAILILTGTQKLFMRFGNSIGAGFKYVEMRRRHIILFMKVTKLK